MANNVFLSFLQVSDTNPIKSVIISYLNIIKSTLTSISGISNRIINNIKGSATGKVVSIVKKILGDSTAIDKLYGNASGTVTITNPVISRLYPSDGSIFVKSFYHRIILIATCSSDTKKVQFFVNGVLRGIDYSPTFNYVWNVNQISVGTYTIKVVAFNNTGSTTVISKVVLK